MAKEETKKDKGEEKKEGSGSLLSKLAPYMTWIAVGVVVLICSGSGFIIGKILAESKTPPAAADIQDPNQNPDSAETGQQASEPVQPDNPLLVADPSIHEPWFYDMDPVVACLDVPGVTRYVRATITIEMSNKVDPAKGEEYLIQRTPVMKNWLTIYLASLTLDDVRGESNLMRIQSQIKAGFNEKLFPDSKSYVNNVLFKEFAIQ